MCLNFNQKVKCNNCMSEFYENEVIYDGEEDMDFCPCCGEGGCIIDLEKQDVNLKMEGLK